LCSSGCFQPLKSEIFYLIPYIAVQYAAGAVNTASPIGRNSGVLIGARARSKLGFRTSPVQNYRLLRGGALPWQIPGVPPGRTKRADVNGGIFFNNLIWVIKISNTVQNGRIFVPIQGLNTQTESKPVGHQVAETDCNDAPYLIFYAKIANTCPLPISPKLSQNDLFPFRLAIIEGK
jgi:hypothetical protein